MNNRFIPARDSDTLNKLYATALVAVQETLKHMTERMDQSQHAALMKTLDAGGFAGIAVMLDRHRVPHVELIVIHAGHRRVLATARPDLPGYQQTLRAAFELIAVIDANLDPDNSEEAYRSAHSGARIGMELLANERGDTQATLVAIEHEGSRRALATVSIEPTNRTTLH